MLLALHVDVPDDRDEQTANEVVERIKVVQPVSWKSAHVKERLSVSLTPEGGDLVVRHEDTTEVDQDCPSAKVPSNAAADRLTRDEKRVDQSRKDRVGRIGGNELADTGVKELVQGHLKVHGACHTGLE